MDLFAKKVPDVKIVDVRIIRDEQGVKRGIGFVDVETQEMAEAALKLDNIHLKGNAIKVYLSKPPSEGDKDENTVFVNNLPFTCTEQSLRAHFLQALGNDPTLIEEVRLIRTQTG